MQPTETRTVDRRVWVGLTNDAISGATQCHKCPDGLTSAKIGAFYEDCQSCAGLLAALNDPAIVVPGCSQDNGQVYETVVVETTPAGEMCGNGEKTSSEDCDDGNTRNSDGCASDCKIEKNWKCQFQGLGLADRCYPSCGDGKLDRGAETCDDGNQQGKDQHATNRHKHAHYVTSWLCGVAAVGCHNPNPRVPKRV